MPLQSIALTRESLLEIDHLIICVNAPVSASALADVGLSCSRQLIRRPQQGTASSLIFFENVYLELIWVEDETAAEIYAMQSGIDFLARANWQKTQSSPFSIALRSRLDRTDGFESTRFEPLQRTSNDSTSAFINFASDNWRTQSEPLCFVIPEAISLVSLLDPASITHQQLLFHPAQIHRLTSASVTVNPAAQLTNSIAMLDREGLITIELRTEPLLDLTFDHRQQKQTIDLRELGVPAVLNY